MSSTILAGVGQTALRGRDESHLDPAGLLRHIAHELRQPLSAIESIACYLGIVLPPGEVKGRAQTDKLQEQVLHADRILSEALHLLQASPPRPEMLDLEKELGAALADLPNAEGLDARFHLDGSPARVRVDPEQLRHMLRSLICFCRQCARPGKPITVRSMSGAGTVCLEVSSPLRETEFGVPESLFRPFSGQAPPGYGLTLASVRRIAEVHGGSFEVRRTADGVSFTAVFPAAG